MMKTALQEFAWIDDLVGPQLYLAGMLVKLVIPTSVMTVMYKDISECLSSIYTKL